MKVLIFIMIITIKAISINRQRYMSIVSMVIEIGYLTAYAGIYAMVIVIPFRSADRSMRTCFVAVYAVACPSFDVRCCYKRYHPPRMLFHLTSLATP